MILRPIGFEYRSQIASPAWREAWDWVLVVSGAVPMIVFGAAFGNLFRGVPFHFEWNMTSFYTGSFLGLLNPFAILTGLLSLALSVMMGGLTVMNGAEGAMHQRARTVVQAGTVAAVVLFAAGGLWVHAIPGFSILSDPGAGIPQTPLHQLVQAVPGAWQANFTTHPVLWLVPAIGFAGMAGAFVAGRAGRSHLGWWLGALAWIGV